MPEFLIFQYLMNLVPGSRRVPSGRFSSRNKAAIVGSKVCEAPGPLVSSVQSIVENGPALSLSFLFVVYQSKKMFLKNVRSPDLCVCVRSSKAFLIENL